MDQSLGILTEQEGKLFEKIQANSYDEVKRILTDEKIRINCLDSHGMTPLQHAAYRGNYELCKLMLDCGADVNSHYHESGYTSLMFAGLAGKLNVVSLLLEHGASTTAVNSVGRTASQMAAFVGNHDVVSIINNFIPKEAVDYYTEVRGLEKEPKLPSALANSMHRLVIKTNIHPVRLALFLQSNAPLLKEAKKVIQVLELLSEKEIKSNGNELLSLKFHHLAFVVQACDSFLAKKGTKKSEVVGEDNKAPNLEPLIKQWIKLRNEDGFPVFLEQFLRQSIREYPYTECPLFQQLVRTLAPVEIGGEPSAISILSQAVTGQRGVEDGVACSTCGEPKAEKKCSACKTAQYCSRDCQKLHWFTHKVHCPELAVKYEEAERKRIEAQEKISEQDNDHSGTEQSQDTENAKES